MNNKIEINGILKSSNISINGVNNSIIIKSGVILNNTNIEIMGNGHQLCINEDVIFREGGRIRIEGENNKLFIGKGSNLVNVFFSIGDSNTKISIGNNCLFSASVIFRNWDNHSIVTIDNLNKRINKGKDITVEDHVWIGYGVTILKNTIIEKDSIIGTMSLVNVNVPANSIAVGNPISIVRNNISWNEKWLNN